MQGADDKTATTRGIISGTAEFISENLFDNVPVKHEEGYWTSQRGYNDIELDSRLFREVTWENSPKKVIFKLVEE